MSQNVHLLSACAMASKEKKIKEMMKMGFTRDEAEAQLDLEVNTPMFPSDMYFGKGPDEDEDIDLDDVSDRYGD